MGVRIEGHTAPGFEPVRAAFAENFRRRGEVGASFVVRRHGEVVVDLSGGLADPTTGRPWEPDTPSVVFSATKGLVAIVLLLLADRGELPLDAPLKEVWPELAGDHKGEVTIRTLMNHRSGLSALDAPLELKDVRDAPSKVLDALQGQRLAWAPGYRQAYGACAWGLWMAELVRRVTTRSVGRVFADEVAAPLALDAWLGMPREVERRRARLIPARKRTVLRHQVLGAMSRRTAEARMARRVLLGRRTLAGKALLNPTLGRRRFQALNDPDVLSLELPWMNAVCTADALAKAYGAVVSQVDGVRLVRPEAVRSVKVRQSWSDRDAVMQRPMGFSQGFVKEGPHMFSPNRSSFGHPGAGGALGWGDPDTGLSMGYVMNHMDWRLRSPRALALTRAVYASL
ncbi:MAG: beta-lactamase family protein [Myxococcales bacterium]|nr:beta-lactamase family protein [Myxococcales bacterium]